MGLGKVLTLCSKKLHTPVAESPITYRHQFSVTCWQSKILLDSLSLQNLVDSQA